MREVLSSWSFPIGEMFGIRVRVHLIMPMVLIGMILHEAKRDGAPDRSWMDAAMLMGLIFFSVLLHEFGHCFAARRMDGEADEVLLWPLGGLAFFRSLPHTPLAHFVTAMGGPLVNLGLCVITGLVMSFALDHHYQPPFYPLWNPYRTEASGAMPLALWEGGSLTTANMLAIVLARLFWVNWVQFLFNVILVGIPFDGGRMLQAALWPRMGHFQATKVVIYSGFGIMVIIGVLAIIFNSEAGSLLVFLAIFIFVSCAQEWTLLESAHEDSLFGYDFSQGYTSLEKEEPVTPKLKKQNFIQRWLARRAARKLQQEQQQREAEDIRMDELLDKIQKFGKESLTDEENRFLKRVSNRFKNKP